MELQVLDNEIIVENEVVNLIKELEKKVIEAEMQKKKLKEALKEAMEKYEITNWTSPDGSIRAIYKRATTRKTVDSKRLKEELPDVYEEYLKEGQVSSSIELKIEC